MGMSRDWIPRDKEEPPSMRLSGNGGMMKEEEETPGKVWEGSSDPEHGKRPSSPISIIIHHHHHPSPTIIIITWHRSRHHLPPALHG